jgi:hypothetical protein
VPLLKNCGSYQSEDIFHDDSKLCTIKFATEEKGKAFIYSYEENYHDVKYLTSQYFHESFPQLKELSNSEFLPGSNWIFVNLIFRIMALKKVQQKTVTSTRLSIN